MKNETLLTAQELLAYTYKNENGITHSDEELLPVFSKNGEQIGVAPRLLCHRLGLIHKVVYLFISNSRKELLVQIRGDSNQIDVPVGGHVSVDDKSEKDALIREMFEELGIKVDESRIKYYYSYLRLCETNIRKPAEINRELRVLYTFEMDESDEEILNNNFISRKEKKAVIDIKWMSLNGILDYCDQSLVADGLKSSLPRYLMLK